MEGLNSLDKEGNSRFLEGYLGHNWEEEVFTPGLHLDVCHYYAELTRSRKPGQKTQDNGLDRIL